MLIDDLLSDARGFVDRHVAIYHNLLPDEEVIQHFWTYVQQDADLSLEMLAGLWLDDQYEEILIAFADYFYLEG